MKRDFGQAGRSKVLIADFDFFSAVGGGQVFYRRVVERNSSIDFYYPSSGRDLWLKSEGKLPANAHPQPFDPRLDFSWLFPEQHWSIRFALRRLAAVAVAVQGMSFQAVDVPSYMPAGHYIRQVLTAFGIMAERYVLGLVGWLSVSEKNGYAASDRELIDVLEAAETGSVESADVRYTISHAEQTDHAKVDLPILLLDMHDAIEMFPPPEPMPPGSGPPDLWYIGRLDGAKGPDLFLQLAAKMPKTLYRRCYFTGPDNQWAPQNQRWSVQLLELANSLGVEATYEGVLSDDEIRSRVYRGRSVIVIPSRNDAFNYVALEAILNACPILLSERTGACGFLRKVHPRLMPETMTPDRLEEAAEALSGILHHYDQIARQKRAELIARPFPSPRAGFMEAVYRAGPVHSLHRQAAVAAQTITLRETGPLMAPEVRMWRPVRTAASTPRVTIIIPTFDRPQFLAPTLACLTRQTQEDIEVLVVDDGSRNAALIRRVVESFAPLARLIRTSNAGEAAAVNRGLEEARGEFIGLLSDDDVYAPNLIEQSVEVLDSHPEVIATYPDWDIIDTSGFFVEAHRLPEFSRELMLTAHWCLPGPGVVVRRETLRKVGGRDTSFRYVSDFDLWLRATRHGPMMHVPRRLAWWRLHESNLTTSTKRINMAHERILLLDKLFSESDEPADVETKRRAYGAAHAAAAAILGRREADEARKHLRRAAQLVPEFMANLPPNMATYPAVWPEFAEQAHDG